MTRLGVGSQARQAMSMRARVVRPQSPGKDPWGGKLPDRVRNPHLDALACYAWSPTDVREVIDGSKDGVLGAVRVIVPADTDIAEGDVILDIADRAGRVLFGGPMHLTAVVRRSGYLAVMARVQRSSREGMR